MVRPFQNVYQTNRILQFVLLKVSEIVTKVKLFLKKCRETIMTITFKLIGQFGNQISEFLLRNKLKGNFIMRNLIK